MKKKKNCQESISHFNRALNKGYPNHVTDCGSIAGKTNSRRNSPNKKLPTNTITKFEFKEFSSEFDPSQDIFGTNLRSIPNSNHTELSSMSETERSQNSHDLVSSCGTKGSTKVLKKKKKKKMKNNAHDDIKKHNKTEFGRVENDNDNNPGLLPSKRSKVEDIVAENLSCLEEEIFSESNDETNNKHKIKLKTNSSPEVKTSFSPTKNTLETKGLNSSLNLVFSTLKGSEGLNFYSDKDDALDNGNSETELSLSTFFKPVKKDKKEKDNDRKKLSLKRKSTFFVSNAVLKDESFLQMCVQNYCDTSLMDNNPNPCIISQHTYEQKISGNDSHHTISERKECVVLDVPGNLNEFSQKEDELTNCNSEINLSSSSLISPAKKSKKHKKGKHFDKKLSFQIKSICNRLDAELDEGNSQQQKACNGLSTLGSPNSCLDNTFSEEQIFSGKDSQQKLSEAPICKSPENLSCNPTKDDDLSKGESETELSSSSPIKPSESASKQQQVSDEVSPKDSTNPPLTCEFSEEQKISDKDSDNDSNSEMNLSSCPSISPAKKSKKRKKGKHFENKLTFQTKAKCSRLYSKLDEGPFQQQKACDELSPKGSPNPCLDNEISGEQIFSDKDSHQKLNEVLILKSPENSICNPTKDDDLSRGESETEITSFSPLKPVESAHKQQQLSVEVSPKDNTNPAFNGELLEEQNISDKDSPRILCERNTSSSVEGFEFVNCNSTKDNNLDGSSETGLSPSRSNAPSKKLKKHKKDKTRNLETGSSCDNLNDEKKKTPSQKKKRSDKMILKGSTKSYLEKFLSTHESLDPEWKPSAESDTGNTSSSENEGSSRLSKKFHKSSMPKGFKNKKKPTMVCSTPFPSKNKGQETAKNSQYSIHENDCDISGNRRRDSLSFGNQTVLEDIQCNMISSEEELEALKNLRIEIDWELSPLHEIDTGSAKLTSAKLKQMLGPRHQKLLKESKYTDHEEAKIRQSWEEFSERYNFSKPDLFFPSLQKYGSFSLKERHNFKLFLAKYLPDRRLLSVYNKFYDIYGCQKKGRWSDKEDRLLLEIYYACVPEETNNGPNDKEQQSRTQLGLRMKTMMSRALERTVNSIDNRLKILLNNDKAKTLSYSDVVWTPELEGELVHRLVKKSSVNSIEDLRYATISYEVWRKVASKLGLTVSVVVNHWKYYLYPQIFARQPILRHILQMELIKWLYDSKYKDYKSIDWSVLSRRAGDLGSCYLYRVFRTLVVNYVPKQCQKNFRESVTFLHEEIIDRLKQKATSQMLIRKEYDPETRTLNYLMEDEEDCIPYKIKSK